MARALRPATLVLMALCGTAFIPLAQADSMNARLDLSDPVRTNAELTTKSSIEEYVTFQPDHKAGRLELHGDLVLYVWERTWQASPVSGYGQAGTLWGMSRSYVLNLTDADLTISHPEEDAFGSSSVQSYLSGPLSSTGACEITPRTLRERDSAAETLRTEIATNAAIPNLPDLYVFHEPDNYLQASCSLPRASGQVEGVFFPFNSLVSFRSSSAFQGPAVLWSGIESRPNATLPGVMDYTQRSIHIRSTWWSPEPVEVKAQDYRSIRVRAPTFAVVGELDIPPSRGNVEWGTVQLSDFSENVTATGTFGMSSPGASEIAVWGETVESAPAPITLGPAPAAKIAVVASASVAAGFALWHLAKRLGLLAFFTRLNQNKLLEHETRQLILQTVTENPGITVSKLVQILAMARRTVLHHLGVMKQHNLVDVRHFGGRTAVYAHASISTKDQPAYALIRAPRTRDLVNILLEEPGLTQEEIAVRMGVSQGHVSRAMRRLAENGILRVEDFGRRRNYRIELSPVLKDRVLRTEAQPVLLA